MPDQDKAAQAARPVDEMTFKEVLDELDEVVRKLESNQLELEESLKCYERGVELLRVAKTRLSAAQQKVTTLLGEIELEPDDDVDNRLS